jgi:hypothetical protein
MATAAAMAALRSTALGDRGGGSCNEDGCHDSRGKDDGNGANGVGDNCPCRPCHRPLCHRNVIANAITHVVAIAIAFFGMQQRGQWQGQQEQWCL